MSGPASCRQDDDVKDGKQHKQLDHDGYVIQNDRNDSTDT